MSHHFGHHHHHVRKRVYNNLEQYPHPKKWIRYLDNLVLSLSVIGPLITLPQAYRIFAEQNATGVSLFTWSFYFLMAIPWFLYGIVHKEKPIIVANIGWITINSIVVVGIILYS